MVSFGDGTLSAYDVRKPSKACLRSQYTSDSFDDDLLSMEIIPSESMIVTSALSGAINLYNLRLLYKEFESIVKISGVDKTLLRLLGQDELIRFCDGSILHEEEDEEDNETKEIETKDDREEEGEDNNSKVSAPRSEFKEVIESKRTSRKSKRFSTTPSDNKSDFFDGL